MFVELQRQEKKRLRQSLLDKQQQQQQHITRPSTADQYIHQPPRSHDHNIQARDHQQHVIPPNLIQCTRDAMRMRVRSPLDGYSSSEHIYEEIPGHFFKERLEQAPPDATANDEPPVTSLPSAPACTTWQKPAAKSTYQAEQHNIAAAHLPNSQNSQACQRQL